MPPCPGQLCSLFLRAWFWGLCCLPCPLRPLTQHVHASSVSWASVVGSAFAQRTLKTVAAPLSPSSLSLSLVLDLSLSQFCLSRPVRSAGAAPAWVPCAE